MQIDQLYRQLKSDPDNVELARQLWNALVREQIPAELADIDVTDPSPKNWKAILKLVNTCETEVRRILRDCLKPLLRLWPGGSRPLFYQCEKKGPFSAITSIRLGTIDLFDSISDQFCGNQFERILLGARHELRRITTISRAGAFNAEFTKLAHESKAFSRLENIKLTNLTALFAWLSGDSLNASEACKHLRCIELFQDSQTVGVERLMQKPELQSNLRALSLGGLHCVPSIFDTVLWPNLEALRLEIAPESMNNTFNHNVLPDHLPKVAQLDLELDFARTSPRNDQFLLLQFHLDFAYDLFCAFEGQAELNLHLRIPEIDNYPEIEHHPIFRIFAAKITLTLACRQGYFVPQCQGPFKKLIIEKHLNFETYESATAFTVSVAKQFSGIESLVLEDHLVSDVLMSSPVIRQFEALKSLTFSQVNLRVSEIQQAFDNLNELGVSHLDYEITSKQRKIVEFINFPKRLTSLALRVDTEFEVLDHIIKASRRLEELHICRQTNDIPALFKLLSHSNCRGLKRIRIDASANQRQYKDSLNDLQLWQSLNWPVLETLHCPALHDCILDPLFDQFPSLIRIKRHEWW